MTKPPNLVFGGTVGDALSASTENRVGGIAKQKQEKQRGVEGAAMDELEFHRILTLFPVVRSRDYHAESESSRQSTSQTKQNVEGKEDAWIDGDTKGINIQDAFWQKLQLAAKKKVGAKEAESFVKAFQHAYSKLVYEELSLRAAKSFINLS